VRCPWCGKVLEAKVKSCPNCKRLLLDSVADAQPRTDHRPAKIIGGSSDDSQHSDVLKPHSRINIKGVGSRLASSPYVTAVRHNFPTSDESESSQKLRCMKCGSVNDKSDKFCKKCGTRIGSR